MSSSIVICPSTAGAVGHVATAGTTGPIYCDVQSLSHRPDRISERTEVGHWECDLMMLRKEHGKVNVTSLVERVSRYAVVMRNEDRQSKPNMEALIHGLAPLPANLRQSGTFDRGTEFSAWKHLKAGIGADAWFCDPQAPYQNGTVENTNNRLRKYLPRSTASIRRRARAFGIIRPPVSSKQS